MEMPEDLLMEILSRVPVKSLLRFKSVSKQWFSVIHINPTFISLHHNRAQTNDCIVASRKVLLRGQFMDDAMFSMYLVPPNQTSSSPPRLQQLDLSSSGLLSDDVVSKAVFFLGCHNGLMCLANNVTSSMVIINPATRESRLLPQPLYESEHRSPLGFTFDPRANDYKVIRFCSSIEVMPNLHDAKDARTCGGDQKVQIYRMSTDSWRETDAIVPKDFPDSHCCTSLDGVFYWVGRDHGTGASVVSAFRTFEELFERILMPLPSYFQCHTQLRVLNDSLALILFGQRRFEIWLMNECGVDKCWTKTYSIGSYGIGCHFKWRHFLGFRQNMEVLLLRPNSGMVSYNLHTQEIKGYTHQLYERLESWGSGAQVFQYAESLISVKQQVD